MTSEFGFELCLCTLPVNPIPYHTCPICSKLKYSWKGDVGSIIRGCRVSFLQVFGCTIDVAVDGVGAVERMNLENYDFVLMGIVMPKLDSISARSMIQQFDHTTPIISTTSNSKPNEILACYSSGVNNILPIPLTQGGLFKMLEKYLMHLKIIQQLAQMPRSVGIPPFFRQLFRASPCSWSIMVTGGSDETDGRINLPARMGLMDKQYYRNRSTGRSSLVCNYHPKLQSSSEVWVVRQSGG